MRPKRYMTEEAWQRVLAMGEVSRDAWDREVAYLAARTLALCERGEWLSDDEAQRKLDLNRYGWNDEAGRRWTVPSAAERPDLWEVTI